MSAVEIRLKRADRVYRPGDTVIGSVVVQCKSATQHLGISMAVEGMVTLEVSNKSVGLVEAFYNSVGPTCLMKHEITLASAGRLPAGDSEFPFEFPCEAIGSQRMFETYHGVFVNIQYMMKVEVKRGAFSKNLNRAMEFIVEVPDSNEYKEVPVSFSISPEALENVKPSQKSRVPSFKIHGKLQSAVCPLTKPFVGDLTVEECSIPIRSIELQLVRVETCGSQEGYAKEATEIQNLQLGDGDIFRGLSIPIYMVLPRLFTCPTVAARNFKVEFEINLVVVLSDGHLLMENFPVRLYRG
jgi:hypothetical protein